MSLSIYSFFNQVNILNPDLKDFYDIIQLNDDKLHSKLKKSDYRKIRRALDKDDLSYTDSLKEMLLIVRQAKNVVKLLDSKVKDYFEYQESIITD